MPSGKPLYENLDDYRKMGESIRDSRENLGLTQIQLAKCVGISHDTMSRIEHGACRTEIMVVLEIAEALDKNIYELLQKKARVNLAFQDMCLSSGAKSSS